MNGADITNKQLLDQMLQAINQVREEGKENKEELKREIQLEKETIIRRLSEQDNKIDLLTKKCKDLEAHCKSLEKRSRKNNILVFGLQIPDGGNLLNNTVIELNNLLEVQIKDSDINNIYLLKSAKIAPIKIEFMSFLKKRLVLDNRRKLKNTGIFLADDLSVEEREDKRYLSKHLKISRSKKYLARIKGRTLIVNGVSYTVEQLREINENEESGGEIDFGDEQTQVGDRTRSQPSSPANKREDALGFLSTYLKTQNQTKTVPDNDSEQVPEKKVDTSSVDPAKDGEEGRKTRTDSASSSASNRSERTTRNKNRK